MAPGLWSKWTVFESHASHADLVERGLGSSIDLPSLHLIIQNTLAILGRPVPHAVAKWLHEAGGFDGCAKQCLKTTHRLRSFD